MERPATKVLNTTLGELIAAASEVAFEYSDNDKDAYRMARLALIEILKRSPNTMVLDEDFDLELTDKKHYH
jgi:hypothetical protein